MFAHANWQYGGSRCRLCICHYIIDFAWSYEYCCISRTIFYISCFFLLSFAKPHVKSKLRRYIHETKKSYKITSCLNNPDISIRFTYHSCSSACLFYSSSKRSERNSFDGIRNHWNIFLGSYPDFISFSAKSALLAYMRHNGDVYFFCICLS